MISPTPTLRDRLRIRLRPAVRRVYLVTAPLVGVLVLEGLLEELGVLTTPAEASIPGFVYLALVIAAFAVGGMIFLGWPVAILVIWLFRRDWPMTLPAIVFLVAEVTFAVQLIALPSSDALFVLAGSLLGAYALSALWGWSRSRAAPP